MRPWLCILAFAAAAFPLTGCGGEKFKPASKVRVSGTVTLDAKPLTTGNISFDPQNGQPPAGFEILDGKYEGLAIAGKNKVSLTAVQKINPKLKYKMDGPGSDQMVDENVLPARYADGTITREVTAEGPNTFDFELKSK